MKSGMLTFMGALMVSGFWALPGRAAQTASSGIITFDAPGADTTPYEGHGTFPSSINDFGVIIGAALDSNEIYHGFVRTPDGKFTRFDVPGTGGTPGSYGGTLPNSVNDLGEIAGYYSDTSGATHGFIRSATGKVTSFDPPNSVGTIPIAINLEGDVVGYYYDSGSQFHAFLRKAGGSLVTFDGPNACTGGTPAGCYGSAAFNVNIFGTVAASFGDNSGNFVNHGLIRTPNGKYTTYDVPGAGTGSYQGTGCPGCSLGINASGAIAGIYTDSAGVYHSYVRTPEGGFVTFDAPGAGGGSGQGTGCASDCSVSINDLGEITGDYIDASYTLHGFFRASNGKVTTVDPAGSIETFPAVINELGAITGTYLDANSVFHGFLRLPPPLR
jgi:hypothetical protein